MVALLIKIIPHLTQLPPSQESILKILMFLLLVCTSVMVVIGVGVGGGGSMRAQGDIISVTPSVLL